MVRGDLTGNIEIVEINGKKYLQVIFCCDRCEYPIVKDSWDHENSHSKDGIIWYCNECEEESEEESEEECTDENRCEECCYCLRTRVCDMCKCIGGCYKDCYYLNN